MGPLGLIGDYKLSSKKSVSYSFLSSIGKIVGNNCLVDCPGLMMFWLETPQAKLLNFTPSLDVVG
jgi:hypothetical protein